MKKNLLIFLILFTSLEGQAQSNFALRCFTCGTPDPSTFSNVGYYINNSPAEYDGCGLIPSIMIAIIDSCTCETLSNCNQNFGQLNQFISSDCTLQNATTFNCRPRPSYSFQFALNDPSAVNGMVDFLNTATTCDYILAYTWFTFPYSTLDPAFKNAFINLGASAINSLPDNAPYIFFAKKGNPSSVQEVVGVTSTDDIILNTNYSCATTGIADMYSPEIINVYPNPVTTGFTINNLQPEKDVQIIITDNLGRIVYSEILTGTKEKFINPKLSSGIYLVAITVEGKTAIRKILTNNEMQN